MRARWPQGRIGGLVPVDGWGFEMLQIQGTEVDRGMSGAPVVAVQAGLVVGMVTGFKAIDRPQGPLRVRGAGRGVV